jgi:hypothetical protein
MFVQMCLQNKLQTKVISRKTEGTEGFGTEDTLKYS